MIAYGPVPSRRLGRSLGVNNIPPKVCSYSCVYCQLGRTPRMLTERRSFYSVQEITDAVSKKVDETRRRSEHIDYLSFVPDGEPTLDSNLGEEIEALKELGTKVAVITNASLLWREDVRDDLGSADWVSVKMDALGTPVWRKVNRPIGTLRHERILQGLFEFSRMFDGKLVTETMLVQGLNDSKRELGKTANFIAGLYPEVSYISIPTRPPAEGWVRCPDEERLLEAYRIFGSKGLNAEYLTEYEGTKFTYTGKVEENLLGITSVHPMTAEAVDDFLRKADSGWEMIEMLLREGRVREIPYDGKRFFLRALQAPRDEQS
ncbi:MAG: radical SAM protein [Thermoplasmata archaeon]|nr:radical SAM protein [Thermoplasmata archaeon]